MSGGSLTSNKKITYTSGELSLPPELRLLHFNDGEYFFSLATTDYTNAAVYHIDASSAEPVGGIARFRTICNEYRNDSKFRGQPGLITLFSGDAFNPSLESSITKGTDVSDRTPFHSIRTEDILTSDPGSHMVPVLNSIGTDVACVGVCNARGVF